MTINPQHPFAPSWAPHRSALAQAGRDIAAATEREAQRQAAVDPTPDPVTCEWFCTCENTTEGMVLHPVLGYVATCARCAEMLELDRVHLDRDLLGRNADGSESLARAMARRNVQLILDGANPDAVMAATRAKVAQLVAERNEVSK